MKKEIKFRAWNKEKMVEFDLEDLMYGTHSLGTVDLKYWTVMQFTGLKDKNGVDIYEGDILKPIDSKVSRAVVEWDINMWSRKWLKVDGGSEFTVSLNDTENSFEVIGNIYQNPELLK